MSVKRKIIPWIAVLLVLALFVSAWVYLAKEIETAREPAEAFSKPMPPEGGGHMLYPLMRRNMDRWDAPALYALMDENGNIVSGAKYTGYYYIYGKNRQAEYLVVRSGRMDYTLLDMEGNELFSCKGDSIDQNYSFPYVTTSNSLFSLKSMKITIPPGEGFSIRAIDEKYVLLAYHRTGNNPVTDEFGSREFEKEGLNGDGEYVGFPVTALWRINAETGERTEIQLPEGLREGQLYNYTQFAESKGKVHVTGNIAEEPREDYSPDYEALYDKGELLRQKGFEWHYWCCKYYWVRVGKMQGYVDTDGDWFYCESVGYYMLED